MELIEMKMTVKEVADAIGYEPETIRKKVKELFPEIVENGKPTMLNEKQVYDLKRNLLPRTPALKSGVDSAITSLDIEEMTLRVIQYHVDKVVQLKAENERQREKIALDAHKVEFHDAVTQSSDTLDFAQVAKLLNIPHMGRNNMLMALRERGILRGDNSPYQQYVDRGYFRLVEVPVTINGKIEIKPKPVVFQKGIDFIRKELAK